MRFFKQFPKRIAPFLIIGIVIRLFLMATTLHSDIWAVSFAEYFFSEKKIVNIYDYIGNLSPDSAISKNYGQNFFTYPPLSYFTLGIFGFLIKPLINADFWRNLAVNLPQILSDKRIYWHLFVTKIPYLFFDFGILWILLKMFDDEKKKITAALLWIFNPLSLYTSFMIGQFDIIPVFFTVLALYLAKEKKLFWAVFSLGVGGAFKMYPLFFIPFLAMSQGKDFKQMVKLVIVGFSPYFFSILPFLRSANFRQVVLLSNQSQKMLFAKIPVSGAEYLSVFVVLYLFLLGLAFIKKIDLWKWFLIVMLLFFSVTHYHPQWFLWISPFLLIFWVKNRKYILLPIILFFSWLVITLLFEPSLSISLFAPVNNSLILIKPLSETLNHYYDVFTLKSLIRSVFAGVSLFMSVLMLKDEKII